MTCMPFGFFAPSYVEAAGVSKEVTTFEELKAALANSSYSTIVVAADITIPYNTTNPKSTTAYLTADRNVTIEGKDGHKYMIKREAGDARDNHSKSILEVWGNGTYDGITVSVYDLIFDGGAVWAENSTPKTRYAGKTSDNNNNTRSTINSGAYGRAIIDVANKGTLNLESGVVVQNGDTTTNSTTRISSGTAPVSGSANYGGGIRVDFQTGGTVNLKAGATIQDCCAVAWGGGIGAYNYARLNLYGGSILRCASASGGGISVTYRGNTASNTAGTIKVFGGEISNCYSPNYGAALVFDGNVAFYLLGGTFNNNIAANSNGGGVLYANSEATVYLSNYSYFQCSGNTGGNYSVNGWATSDGIYKNSATIKNAPVVTVTFKSDGITYTTLQCVMGGSLGDAFPGEPHKANSIFQGWYNGTTQFTKSSQVQSAITVNAKWHTHSYSYEGDGNTITLICSGENDCPYKDSPPKLTLSGTNSKVYDRSRFSGIKVVNDITAISGVSASAISYENADGSGEPSELAPMDIGTYKAKVSLGGATAVYDFSITRGAEPNYEIESMNNRVNNEGKIINHITGGEEAKADLQLYLHNSSDEVKLYRIAEIVWSENNYDYYDPEWVEPVANWISGTSYATQQSYLNPLTVAELTSSVQSEFFNNMLEESSSLFSTVEGDGKLTELTGLAKSGPTEDSEKNQYYLMYSDLEPGVYAAVSPNGAYAPCVVSILPKRSGPASGWYLESLYVASLKSASAKVNKFINNEDFADTVAVGEKVKFDIEFSFTSLYADRITLSDSDAEVKDYRLYAIDTMSSAYRMVEDNGQIVMPTLKYYIKDSDDSKGAINDLPTNQSFYQFADSSYTGKTKYPIDDSNAATYLYNGTTLYETNKELGKAIFAVENSGSIYSISTPQVVNGITTFQIDYNVSALKGFIDSIKQEPNKVVLVLSYEAIVTDKAKVNSEENTNKITLHYEKTKDTLDEIDDIVYGFTYGLNVVKIDGNSLNEEKTKYIAGAKFRLYKEVDVAPASGAVTYEYNDPVKGPRHFVLCTNAYLDGAQTYDENGCFTSVASEKGVMLSGLKDGKYILEEFKAPEGYNELSEDIYFEINQLPEDIAIKDYNGFYKSFVELQLDDQEKVINDAGYIKLDVLNYKGLTLPSTGGMGTLLFTIIGCALMISTMVIVTVKNKKRDYMY